MLIERLKGTLESDLTRAERTSPRQQGTLQSMEETLAILRFENDPNIINALDKAEIMKATTSNNMLNLIYNNNMLYKMQPLEITR